MDRTPGTFSQTIHLARARRRSARYASVRLPRGSSKPSRNPATEKDWQGVPAQRRSTGSPCTLRRWAFRIAVKSPNNGTRGYRSRNTARGNRSISLKNTGSQPSGTHATEGASIPLHTVANLTVTFPSGRVGRSTGSAHRRRMPRTASNRRGTRARWCRSIRRFAACPQRGTRRPSALPSRAVLA